MIFGPLETNQDYQNLNRDLRRQAREFLRNQAQLPIAPVAIMTTFISDPFEGDINPGDTSGLKLFTLATSERSKDDKLAITQDNVKDVMASFRQDSNSFGWGILVNQIKDPNDKSIKILSDFENCTLDLVKAQAVRTFKDLNHDVSDPFPANMNLLVITPATNDDHKRMFFRQTRSRMIAKRIKKSLTKSAWNTLFSKRKHFSWESANGTISYDGPTMLQILVSSINPTTRVGISDLKTNLRSARLVTFQFNVKDLCDKMIEDYELIIERPNGKHDDIVLDLFNALLSGKNNVFTSFVQRKKDAWETGNDEPHEQLIEDCITKYNNMVKQGIWKQEEAKDSKIVALVTKVNELESRLASKNTSSSTSSSSSQQAFSRKFGMDDWRFKKDGDSKKVDGEQWWWCPHHVQEGVYDGLYVKHPPEKHAEWEERKKNNKLKSSSFKDSAASAATDTSKAKLSLSNSLKAAMVTNFQCSQEQADRLYSEVVQGNLN